MPFSPQKAGAADLPPGPNPPARRGAPHTSDAFAGMLNVQQARTATAEGQPRSPERSDSRRNDDDRASATTNDRPARSSNDKPAPSKADKPGDDKPDATTQQDAKSATTTPAATAAAVSATSAKPAATAAQTAAQQVPSTNTNTNTPNTPTAQQPSIPTPTTAQQLAVDPKAAPAQGGSSSTATVPAVNVQGSTDSTAAAAHGGAVAAAVSAVDQKAAQPAQAQQQVPVASQQQQPVAQQAPVAAPQPKQPGANTAGAGQQNAQTQGQNLPEQTAPQAGANTNTSTSSAPQAQPQQAAPATAPTGGQPAPVVAPNAVVTTQAERANLAPATPVPLARAAEAVEHVVRLASQNGVTQARIALHPEELGGIDVHLRSTPDGIVARVVAHAPEAAQQLQQAAADLRKSLEGQGLNLLNLDIGHQADQRTAGGAGAGTSGQGRDGSGAGSATGGGDEAVAQNSTEATLQLPNGVLVDVLA